MVVVDQVGSTQIEQNHMKLDRYPAMKRILEEYSEIESKPSDDRVGSTQIEPNQGELDRYPAMKRLRKIKSKPSDDRVGSTQVEPNQRELDRYPAMKRLRKIKSKPSDQVGFTRLSRLTRILEEYREIESNPSDDFKCGMLERNPYKWQFGFRGIFGTEFEGGVYHGWIQFPEEYPLKPPSFTFLTENGRFKPHNKIRIRRLNDWQPSWGVRDALDALMDEMPTYPDGELGSVEYNKEERRDLAIKSRAAPPKYGSSERQKLIAEIHKYLLSKSPPVPVMDEMPTYPDGELGSVEYNKEERRDLAIKSRAAPPKYGSSERQKLIAEIHKYLLSKSPPVPVMDEMPTYPDGELGSVEYNKEERRDLAIKSRAAPPKYGSSERQKLIAEIHKYLLSKSPPVPVPQLSPSQASNGKGGSFVVNGGYAVSGNTFHATNSNGVGILDSMNAFSDEGHELLPSWLKLFRWRKQNW
ncbi:hypothetical protein CerSpe_107360 [Prunus speciosa]